ncbi:glycerophosphodiester phosphodiesterase family protein [candidate division KSB1 bacterium]|nr:glycerophosphodiester phosphodiesterase family protein [candidate division KSB1 bacterium]
MIRISLLSNLCLMILFGCTMIITCDSNRTVGSDRFLLIAHRGGVVDDSLSENSIKGLEEAIRRGYTHVEVDARVTRDGHVVCFHDENLFRETGIDKNISDLTLAELQEIPLTKSREPIPTFDEFCSRCAGRIDLMVDTKGVEERSLESYVNELESSLTRYKLLKEALFILNRMPVRNQDKVADWFVGKARTAWRYDLVKTKIRAHAIPDVGKYHFVFNSPRDFSKEMIDGFHKLGLMVIASVNLAHYPNGDPLKQGLADIEKMFEWGIDGLQIDSCYDPLIFKHLKAIQEGRGH